MELRREALAPELPDDEQFQQKELGVVPRAVLENAAIVLVAALLVGGAWINSNRASSTATSSPSAQQPSDQGLGTTVGGSPSTGTSQGGSTAPATAPPPRLTAGYPKTSAGAGDAAAAFATALTESLWNGDAYIAVIRSSAGPNLAAHWRARCSRPLRR
jgi:hypothetical protein